MEVTSEELKQIHIYIGNIYTCNETNPTCTVVVTKNNLIEFAGKLSDAERYLSKPAIIHKLLPNQIMLPGLIDTHVHPSAAASEMLKFSFKDNLSYKENISSLQAYIKANPDLPVYLVERYSYYKDQNYTQDLESICPPTKPLIMHRYDSHARWGNKKALELAGITAKTPDLVGGHFGRDAKGELTGELFEEAKFLVEKIIPPQDQQALENAMKENLRSLVYEGITTISDAWVTRPYAKAYLNIYDPKSPLLREWPKAILAFGALFKEDKIQWSDEGVDNISAALPLLLKMREACKGKLSGDYIKLFVDGVVEAHTAWLLSPYLTGSKDCGKPMRDFEEVKKDMDVLYENGFTFHVHAVGDGAVSKALELIVNYKSKGKRRNIVAHTVCKTVVCMAF